MSVKTRNHCLYKSGVKMFVFVPFSKEQILKYAVTTVSSSFGGRLVDTLLFCNKKQIHFNWRQNAELTYY